MTELVDITLEQVRRRLSGTSMPPDPLAVVLPPEIPRWPKRLEAALTTGLIAAGVLIPVVERRGEMSLLFTQRAAHLKHHASQISFPGGRMESGDRHILDTALRETQEEIGIGAEDVEVAGFLDPAPTVTGYAVTPVVGVVKGSYELVIDTREVDEVFEVPLAFLMDSRNQEHSERDFRGHRVPVVEFNFGRYRIWGATASMVIAFRNSLLKNKKI
jgi:8-oxo-dGTP pyrophosphatase MutT (NUDIX family)